MWAASKADYYLWINEIAEEIESDVVKIFGTEITTLDHLYLEGIQSIVADSESHWKADITRGRRGEGGCIWPGWRGNGGGKREAISRKGPGGEANVAGPTSSCPMAPY